MKISKKHTLEICKILTLIGVFSLYFSPLLFIPLYVYLFKNLKKQTKSRVQACVKKFHFNKDIKHIILHSFSCQALFYISQRSKRKVTYFTVASPLSCVYYFSELHTFCYSMRKILFHHSCMINASSCANILPRWV